MQQLKLYNTFKPSEELETYEWKVLNYAESIKQGLTNGWKTSIKL